MHPIEEAFGPGCNLYDTVLGGCPHDATKAQLRKAYYRAALKYHPDKQTAASDKEEATRKFQAISLAYQYLSHKETRAAYDETGELPDASGDVDEANAKGVDAWRSYFSELFGKVTVNDIDAFATKYKCSDEERRDVLRECAKRKGNLNKMLEFVLLSEPRDVPRWVEDYLKPAFEDGSLSKEYQGTVEKTLAQMEKKIQKEAAKQAKEDAEAEEEDDDEETESEHSEEEAKPSPAAKRKTAVKKKAHKAKPTKTKKKAADDNMASLVAQIQKRRGKDLWNDIGARYGVPMQDNDDDPLDDAAFAKIQAGMQKKKRRR